MSRDYDMRYDISVSGANIDEVVNNLEEIISKIESGKLEEENSRYQFKELSILRQEVLDRIDERLLPFLPKEKDKKTEDIKIVNQLDYEWSGMLNFDISKEFKNFLYKNCNMNKISENNKNYCTYYGVFEWKDKKYGLGLIQKPQHEGICRDFNSKYGKEYLAVFEIETEEDNPYENSKPFLVIEEVKEIIPAVVDKMCSL